MASYIRRRKFLATLGPVPASGVTRRSKPRASGSRGSSRIRGPTCLQTFTFSNGREAASGYWGGISEQYQWSDFFWA